jgi:hypothetical protein
MNFSEHFLPNIVHLPLLLGYAEIHYHLKFLYPRYFLKEPEIIADIPIRCIQESSSTLPVLIIVKDADLFPVTIKNINVLVTGENQEISGIYDIEIKLSQKYFSKILKVDLSRFQPEQWLNVTVEFQYEIKGKPKTTINDNYPELIKKPFRFFYAGNKLPFQKNWFLGDPHYHSIHTADQVEFGADILSTKQMAKAMGLDWFFVTDHSYDLDDCVENCTKNDPELPIWKEMKQEVVKTDDKDFRVIAGEEVSIGNSDGKNVHMLAINHDEFIEGSGDSAEKWFRNKPQHLITEIKQKHSIENLFIAAHPFDEIPFAQKLTLRRGSWHPDDFINGDIKFLQIINSANPDEIYSNILKWSQLLLQGKKYFILAGNDAHGNFNVMRQIKSPFWKLFSSSKQVFGKFFTAFKFSNNHPVAGIKNGELIVSNGPFINFQLQQNKQIYNIGSSCPKRKATFVFETATNIEFGEITRIVLHIGDLTSMKETKIENPESGKVIDLPECGYLRMSLTTEKGGLSFTNPIWVD